MDVDIDVTVGDNLEEISLEVRESSAFTFVIVSSILFPIYTTISSSNICVYLISFFIKCIVTLIVCMQ